MQKFQHIQKTGATKHNISKNYEKIQKINMILGVFKTTLVGVVKNITADEFVAAFWRWLEPCEKSVGIGGN